MHILTAALQPFLDADLPPLTTRQVALIGYLASPSVKAPSTMDAADALGVTKPIVTRAMDALEANGLAVTKRDHAGDQRKVVMELTAKGRKLVKASADAVRRAQQAHARAAE